MPQEVRLPPAPVTPFDYSVCAESPCKRLASFFISRSSGFNGGTKHFNALVSLSRGAVARKNIGGK